MIGLTRTNGDPCRLDPDHVQRVEHHHDTVVFLSDGAKYAVAESVDEVVATVREARASALAAVYRLTGHTGELAPTRDGRRAAAPVAVPTPTAP